jgi:hypothetical protein
MVIVIQMSHLERGRHQPALLVPQVPVARDQACARMQVKGWKLLISLS